jgi:dipeptidyl aminopeptidase/acylaminoacyl peptidase
MLRPLPLFPPLLALAALGACAPGAAGPGAVSPNAAPPAAASPPSPSGAPAAPAAPVASGYDKPPQNVLDVMRAPAPPAAYVSPTRDRMLMLTWVEYPPMALVAEPYLKLAGVRVEPRSRRKHDTPGGYGVSPCLQKMTLTTLATKADVAVALPPGCADDPTWAADGKRFVFRNAVADAVELWVGNAETGEAHRVPGVRLNPMLQNDVAWMPDQKTVLVKLVPDDAGAPPASPVVPSGPSIQETGGGKGESSTYETRDTLTSKHDEDLFDYYATSQLATVDVVTGTVTRLGKPGVYTEVERAPDGEHLLVATIRKPYSYVTTYERFAHDVAVWDRSGKVVHPVASLPLADRVPVRGVPTGPRELEWRATEPATLVWAEALDGGDLKVNVPARDKVMMLKAPFTAPAVEIARTEHRFRGLSWSERPGVAFLREVDDNKHWARVYTLDVDDRKAKPRLLWDLSTDERYKNPGTPVRRRLPNGESVVELEGNAIFLQGQGASPDGDRPFVDRFDLGTGKSERLFRSDKAAFESFLAFTAGSPRRLLTWHQSPTDPPNVMLRTLGAPLKTAPAGEPVFASTREAVTHMTDPTPAVREIKKRLVKYKRADGTDLSFTLYTPPGYKEGTRVPAILSAYPLDYADASKAGQVTGSEQTFTRLRQYRLLLLAGYAIIDNAAFPIVGDPKKAYDTYLEQLVADAKAAVDKAVALGVVDPDRIGVTGHSHGALMTANLVAHSDLFRAGVATSGSYNKTLTPFGFQNERRSVWDAQDVYLKASTFFFANKLKLPLLIVHGEDDANPGTTPIQARKLFEAIRGNGGTARLVMLPHEPHWYAAMESNEHLVAEMIRWFDTYVKNAPPKGGAVKASAAAAP